MATLPDLRTVPDSIFSKMPLKMAAFRRLDTEKAKISHTVDRTSILMTETKFLKTASLRDYYKYEILSQMAPSLLLPHDTDFKNRFIISRRYLNDLASP